MTISDHCPVKIQVNTKTKYPYEHVSACAEGFRSYSHYDINKKLRRPINIEHCNLINLVKGLDTLGNKLLLQYTSIRETKEEIELLELRMAFTRHAKRIVKMRNHLTLFVQKYVTHAIAKTLKQLLKQTIPITNVSEI